ncbi:hypothetical protein [Roseomonas gilardii]|uniref:hypothetical protein n=1 Tax=Roseomonas gilardii TaxID=257708 RepID=UPI00119F1B2D|nr:hypothetical protein [Roseomonas gilardii]
MPSIIITDEEFQELPEDVRQLLLAKFQGGYVSTTGAESTGEPGTSALDAEEMPDLSPAQARRLVDRITDKTLNVLQFIARSKDGSFSLNEAIKANGFSSANDLRGVWAAITRRSRKVMGDDELALIWWNQKPTVEGENTDWEGRISEMTHRSLRKALNIT